MVGVTVLLWSTHAVHDHATTWLCGIIYFLFDVIRHLIVASLSIDVVATLVVFVVLTVTTFICTC